MVTCRAFVFLKFLGTIIDLNIYNFMIIILSFSIIFWEVYISSHGPQLELYYL